MGDAISHISLSKHICFLLDEGEKSEKIIAKLIDEGHDAVFVRELVTETGKLREAKRRTHGLLLILAGSVICLASFLLSITSGSTNNLPTVLFGLTTLGIVVAFAGLVKVF